MMRTTNARNVRETRKGTTVSGVVLGFTGMLSTVVNANVSLSSNY